MGKFNIPASATLLREIDQSLLDLRTDEEIIAQLQKLQPITSEKNIFAIWDGGYHKMPPCHQNTVLNWVRRLGPSWTVHLIDFVENSPTNIYNYVGKEWFPECFVSKTMAAKHSPQHAADLARLPLIHQWGGAWLDVSNMLHVSLDSLFWDHLSAPDTPYEMAAWIITGQIRNRDCDFGNFMFAARKGCEFIKKWHEGYLKLWEGRTSADDFHKHPLIQEIGLAEGLANPEDENQVKLMTDYVAQMVIGDRTKNLLDVNDGWNGREFWEKKVYQVEGIQNGILGALRTNLDGQKQADYFTTRLDEPDLEKRAAAEEFIIEMLEKSVMYKVWHNSMGDNPALGDLVKKKGLEDITHRPGTFGELYRYGTVHWESARVIERLEPKKNGELQDPLIHGTPTKTAAETKQ
ncbi:capsule polysaccharide biosynthesis protein [Fusarium heterosporum]|uniref:Capsule polysaccharide biosynthesis protein n=1 Tax=Fusarium heterosporum TaxID=42747 RepID=A0A8H5X134_FUSHE|nr:capsule polysaccharide biosynthesis protein [Fusarium heterosporum]